MNPDRLEDDEADPTPGLFGVIVDVPLARQVVVPVVGGVGGDEDAVSQLDRPDAERREDVGKPSLIDTLSLYHSRHLPCEPGESSSRVSTTGAPYT